MVRVVGNIVPQAEVTSSNSKIMNVKDISAPTGKRLYSVNVFRNEIYVGTTDGGVYKYVGSWGSGSWELKLTAYGGVRLEHDGTHLLATTTSSSNVYHTTDGTTWTNSSVIHGTPAWKKAWLGNGTVLGAGYSNDAPVYLHRSNDYGQSWSMWKNFTAIYPQTAQKIATGGFGLWRHAHSVAYATNYIAVGIGDGWRATVVSRDGGNTWSIERHGAFINAITFTDRIVMFPDGQDYLVIYWLATQKYQEVRLQDWENSLMFWATYDSTNDVIYADHWNRNYTLGIVASPDKGESWVTLYKTTVGGEIHLFPYYNSGYIYFTKRDGYLYRFEALTNNAVRSMADTKFTYSMYGNSFYYDFGNASQVVDTTVSWTKINMTNNLKNSDMEQGMATSGKGFPCTWSYKWNIAERTFSIDNAGGLNGTKALKIEFKNQGNYLNVWGKYNTVTDRPSFPYNYGVLVTVWLKMNRTTEGLKFYPVYFFNDTLRRLGGSEGECSEILIPSTNWYKITQYIAPPSASRGVWYGYPHFMIVGMWTANLTNIPATTLWMDNVTVYPIPHHTYSLSYTTTLNHRGFYNEKIKWVANGSVMNTETPIVKVNDVQIASGQTLEKVASPLKVEVQQGGLLQFTFTKVKTYAESDSAITSSSIAENLWAFTIFASNGQTSTTKVYVGNKGEPTQVYTINGTLTWSFNASTKILTLNVSHNGPATVLVDWRIPGDVDGNGKVVASDLLNLSKAYGSTPASPKWNQNCDFNGDNIISVLDLYPLGKNYGKTKP